MFVELVFDFENRTDVRIKYLIRTGVRIRSWRRRCAHTQLFSRNRARSRIRKIFPKIQIFAYASRRLLHTFSIFKSGTLHQKFNFFFDIKVQKKEPAALRQALLAVYIPQGLAELRHPHSHSRNLLLALLDERDLVGLTIDHEAELSLRINYLGHAKLLSHYGA